MSLIYKPYHCDRIVDLLIRLGGERRRLGSDKASEPWSGQFLDVRRSEPHIPQCRQ